MGPKRYATPHSRSLRVVSLSFRSAAHVLSAPDLELANCKLKDADVTRIVGKLNTIWHKAGIHFGLESIVREPAAQRGRFRLMAELRRGTGDLGFPVAATQEGPRLRRPAVLLLS